MSILHFSRRRSLVACLGATTLIVPTAVLAGAFHVQEQSVKGLGRAYAGEAADTGAAQLWWNPAAIARSPREVYVGAHRRFSSTGQTDQGSTVTRPIPPAGLTTPVGGRADISDTAPDITIPNGAIALPVSDRLAVGLSVTRPYHLENDFGRDAWTRYDTIRNRIVATDVQATGAIQVNDWLDLGAGVSGQYTEAYLDAAYPNLSPLLPDALSRLEGDGWNYGWTAGAQAHFAQVSVGASYRSSMDHDLDGTLTLSGLQAPLDGSNFSAPAETHFETPWMATVAGRWRVTPALTLNAQAQRLGWSRYDKITVAFAGQGEAIPQNFKDVTALSVGADYALSPRWMVRAGLQFTPTPSPDELREPGVADADKRLYSVGATAQLRGGLALDLAVGHTRYEDSAVIEDAQFYAGTPAATTARLRGRFGGNATVASAGLRWGF